MNVSINGDSITALGNSPSLWKIFLISNQNWSSWLLHSLLVLSFIPEVDPRIVNVSPWLHYHRPITIHTSCQSEELEVVNVPVAHSCWKSAHFIFPLYFFTNPPTCVNKNVNWVKANEADSFFCSNHGKIGLVSWIEMLLHWFWYQVLFRVCTQA